MNKKVINSTAQRIFLQVNSILNMLDEKHLVISYNKVPPPDLTKSVCQISWYNHISDRANCGQSFTKLEQYLHILKNNSYHCLLLDGSIIRANFVFDNDILITENLLWWPSPYDYGNILVEGYSPVDIVNDFFCDKKWYDVIKMRSPIRIDYDGKREISLNHPHTHMHIEHEETRMSINKPICFAKFISFIFKNFYSTYNIDFDEQDFIEFKIRNFESIEHLSSQIVI